MSNSSIPLLKKVVGSFGEYEFEAIGKVRGNLDQDVFFIEQLYSQLLQRLLLVIGFLCNIVDEVLFLVYLESTVFDVNGNAEWNVNLLDSVLILYVVYSKFEQGDQLEVDWHIGGNCGCYIGTEY